MDAEIWHKLAIAGLRVPGADKILKKLYPVKLDPPNTIAGLTFPNRIGLAAGFDKNGVAGKALAALGFGHIEFGTVTKQKQLGNPKPRITKTPYRTIFNNMGMPNCGYEKFHKNLLANYPDHCIVGVSIAGKEISDFTTMINDFYGLAHYITINLSCPNVENQPDQFIPILKACQLYRDNKPAFKTPLFVKLPGNIELATIERTVKSIADCGMNGFIATNSHPSRNGAESGRKIKNKSLAVVAAVKAHTPLPVVGCGGILSVSDAKDYFNAGAELVQIYSGLVFNGPSFPSKLVNSFPKK